MDFATLAGAAIVALGDDKAAAFESNSKLILSDILPNISSEVDEWYLELPITAARRASIKHSDIADLVNHTKMDKVKRYLRQVCNTF